ncbi:MAG: M20/M25/M40 family metallo-hydrolase [Candidatus Cloacimonetes bacterium]|nr:M20/M25/M40 family metallo-hydrolase [Candidatus Cloacimonadota bacterium]
MTHLELLQLLTLTPGISGHEGAIRQIMKDELGLLAPSIEDRLGQIAFSFGKVDIPKILFLGHMDEIGFIVAGFTDSGLLKVHNIGGWDPRTALSSPVTVITNQGKFPGIFSSVPVHHQKKDSPPSKLEIEDLCVDIGAKNKQDVIDNYGIQLGDQIIPVCHSFYNKKSGRFFSKAFDNRVGVGSAIELGKAIAGKELPNTVVCGGSVQEEVGLRGASIFTNLVKPDVAFIVEGPPADDTIPSEGQCKLDAGVQVRLFDPTMIVPKGLSDYVIATAKDAGIPIQLTVRRRGGTDAGRVHLTHQGIPSIVLGVPVRYAHSHNGVISMADYDNLIKLMIRIAETFDKSVLEQVIKG